MKTNQISEKEILRILAGYEQVTSAKFFEHVPEVLLGGQSAKDFGKIIHCLAREKYLTSKCCEKDKRIWQITALGRSVLETDSRVN